MYRKLPKVAKKLLCLQIISTEFFLQEKLLLHLHRIFIIVHKNKQQMKPYVVGNKYNDSCQKKRNNLKYTLFGAIL